MAIFLFLVQRVRVEVVVIVDEFAEFLFCEGHILLRLLLIMRSCFGGMRAHLSACLFCKIFNEFHYGERGLHLIGFIHCIDVALSVLIKIG